MLIALWPFPRKQQFGSKYAQIIRLHEEKKNARRRAVKIEDALRLERLQEAEMAAVRQLDAAQSEAQLQIAQQTAQEAQHAIVEHIRLSSLQQAEETRQNALQLETELSAMREQARIEAQRRADIEAHNRAAMILIMASI